MKTKYVLFGVLGILAVVALFLVVWFVGVMNQEVRLRNAIVAKQRDNTSEFDNMFKKISQVAQVTDAQKNALLEIFKGYAGARSADKEGGSSMGFTPTYQNSLGAKNSVEPTSCYYSEKSFAPSPKKRSLSRSVSVGAGAEINQTLKADSLGLDGWKAEPEAIIRLYFCFKEQFLEIVKSGGIQKLEGEKEGYLKNLPVG